MTHSAEKFKRGILGDLLTYMQLQNIKKTRMGDPLKNFRKEVAQCRQISKGDLLGTSGFVGYV